MNLLSWLKAPWIRLAAWLLVSAAVYALQQWGTLPSAPTWLPIAIAMLGQIASHFRVPGTAQKQLDQANSDVKTLTARLGGGAALVLLFGLSQSGCLPASFPSDVLKVYECVQTEIEGGVTNVGQIMLACKAPEEQVVIDAINSLLDSPKWVGEHPQLVREMVKMGGRAR